VPSEPSSETSRTWNPRQVPGTVFPEVGMESREPGRYRGWITREVCDLTSKHAWGYNRDVPWGDCEVIWLSVHPFITSVHERLQ